MGTARSQDGAAAAATDGAIDLAECLDRTWRLDRLALARPGETVKQFSSYDRTARDANRDWGNYLRSSRAEGNVCAEMDGPGVIYRIWSANPSGRLRIFLDGGAEPVLDLPFAELFGGDASPFPEILAYRISGANCYFPMPYRESCKVVLTDNAPLYYHVGYGTFPEGTDIETFTLESIKRAGEALRHAEAILSHPGPERAEDIHPGAYREIPLAVSVPAGEGVALLDRTGNPGRIVLLELKASSLERHRGRKTLLRIFWDGEPQPAVECPLEDFFGTAFDSPPFAALPMGVTDRGGYCLFPMPFEQGARIEIENQGRMPVEVTGRIRIAPLPETEGTRLRFHAGWRRENPCATFDYPILDTHGMGIFVGCALFIDNPRAFWWGEGDEKIYVDGEEFPSTYGTGSEDYFGDAWGHRRHIRPFQGCTLRQDPSHGNKTCVYRFHIADAIPFTRSLRMTIENYAEIVDYASVAWWYQAPGGRDFFKATPVAGRLPKGPTAMNAIEAETLTAESETGKVFVIDDTDLPRPLSGSKGLLLKGHGPFTLTLPVDREDNFVLSLGLAHDLSHRPLTLSAPAGRALSAEAFPAGRPGFLESRRVAVLHLTLEHSRVRIAVGDAEASGSKAAKTTDDGTLSDAVTDPITESVADPHEPRTVIDFIRLTPVPRRKHAVECETLRVISVTGGRVSPEYIRLPFSAGTQLRLIPDEDTALLELGLDLPMAGVYALSGICAAGPGYGPFNAALDGEPLGEIVPDDLEDAAPLPGAFAGETDDGSRLKRFILATRSLAAGEHTLTIAGRERVGLDCLFLEWSLGGEYVFEGEALKVIDAGYGEYQVQDLDRNLFSRGAQLWLKGKEVGAFIETAFELEDSGRFAMKIHFCRSWDYGMVQVLLDGKPLGEAIDLYQPKIVPSGPVDLGIFSLDSGSHRLKFLMTGRNPRSAGYFLGVDGVTLQPMPESDR